MTSADGNVIETAALRKGEGVPRKPSFKCGTPLRGHQSHPRVTRKVVLSATTVQTLTNKFNLLSGAQSSAAAKPSVVKAGQNFRVFVCQTTGKKRTNNKLADSNNKTDVKHVETAPVTCDEKKPQPQNSDGVTVSDKNYLPVKAAIEIFESVGTEKYKKPVAAIKPILKVVDDKPKPKLSPKDSLCRVRYNVMRRSKEAVDEIVKSDDDSKIFVESTKIDSALREDCDRTKSEKFLHGKENKSEEVDNVPFVNNVKPEVQSQMLEAGDNLSNGFNNSDSAKVNSIFNQISKSNIYTNNIVGKDRRFATMLKNNVEENDSFLNQTKLGGTDRDVMTNLANIMKTSMNEKKVLSRIDSVIGGVEMRKKLPEELLQRKVDESGEKLAVEKTTNVPIKTENDYGSLKPNSSFLWSKPAPEPQSKPLPKPPENFIPDILYETPADNQSIFVEEAEYDDICSRIFEEEIYDDVGVYSLNEKNGSLYYISDQLDSLNIYEDIQSLRASVEGYEPVNGAGNLEGYEVVTGGRREFQGEDDQIYEGVRYESIYGGRSVRSDESVKSSFEKNNSIYGVLPNGINATSTESVSEASSVYREAQLRNGGSPTESEISNSDDWIDEVSDSEPEQTIGLLVIQERNKKPSRANWSELHKRTSQKCANEELPTVENEEHIYQSITQEESNLTVNTTSTSTTTIPTDDLADDSSCIDDFESSDEECPNVNLPAPPTTQYIFPRSLRAAGKKIRQNLTLRKSDFSKSWKKLRPRLRTEADDKSPDTSVKSSSSNSSSKFYCEVGGEKSRRPNAPPPPPPAHEVDNSRPPSGVQYADLKINGSELYAKAGLFKQRLRTRPDSRSSWYDKIGLYGTSGNYDQPRTKQIFADEPLYQFYTECVNQKARDDILRHCGKDDYEAINDYYTSVNEKRRTLDVKVGIPNLEDFASEPERKISFQSENRTLWCQMPEVVNSCVVPTLTEQQRMQQEAKFEILTSEGSYIHSLTVLEVHFMPKLSELVNRHDHRLLFSNILAVKAVSEMLLNDLEACWRGNIMLMGLSDIIHKYAVESFDVYVKFCKHHSAMYRTLRDLSDNNSAFSAALGQLQNSPVCHSLSLHSFLLLPMQRITRLPLLLGAVLARLEKTDEEYQHYKNTFDILNKIVKECDDEACKMDKCEEMLLLSQQLEFQKGCRQVPIISGNRVLVKRGTGNLVLGKEDSKMTFGRRPTKSQVVVLLFTDLLILARPKGRSLVVIDYCARNMLQMEVPDASGLAPMPSQKNLVLLTLLENHENKTVETMISFELESDIQRWSDVICPKLSENPEETVYEEWDCPQIIAIYEFNAAQPDDLSLCIGDVVNVLRKISDGWYQGERLRDGAKGWFPANHTQEISSPHVRAKNKKERYKLLALSGNFLQQQQQQQQNGKLTGVS